MVIKKSDLCSSLWASCDELLGGMNASRYKDCVLLMLFIKNIRDKYVNSADFSPPVVMPRSAWSVLKRFVFQLPSPDAQTASATLLCVMDSELSVLEARLIKTRAIKQGMMQELLTGRTRLV